MLGRGGATQNRLVFHRNCYNFVSLEYVRPLPRTEDQETELSLMTFEFKGSFEINLFLLLPDKEHFFLIFSIYLNISRDT